MTGITYLFICSNMATEFDLSEGSFADGLAQDILSDLTLVRSKFDIIARLDCLDANLIRVTDSFVDGSCCFLGWLRR